MGGAPSLLTSDILAKVKGAVSGLGANGLDCAGVANVFIIAGVARANEVSGVARDVIGALQLGMELEHCCMVEDMLDEFARVRHWDRSFHPWSGLQSSTLIRLPMDGA